MGRRSWLDSIVYRFQHHWETNPQYRAAVSGVVGLVLILSLCTCMGVLNRTAGAALAAVGFGTGDAGPLGTPNTGTNKVGCCNSFPTPTVLYPTNAPAPHATVPESQTPPPYATATEAPTPTDTPNPGGGGGGGGGGGSCTGSKSGTDWSFTNPCPPIHGQNVTFTISATKYGGQQIQVHITCGSTLIGSPSPFALPPSGVWSQTVMVAASDAGQQCTGFYQIYSGAGVVETVAGPTVQ